MNDILDEIPPRVLNRIQQFTESEAEMRFWLKAKHPMLENKSPLDLIQEGDLFAVFDLLARISGEK